MRQFSPQQLHEHLQTAKSKPLLLDVREPWEFEICHIDGSQLIPMGHVPAEADQLDATRETVVICHHGVRSYRVAYYLEQCGFTNVINLMGGVAAWARDIDPNMPTY